MKLFIKNYYNKLSLNQFIAISILLCIISDFSLHYLLQEKLLNMTYLLDIFKLSLKLRGIDEQTLSSLPDDYLLQIINIAKNSLLNSLLIFNIVNLVFYYFFWKKKLFAWKYVKTFCWTTFPLSVIGIPFEFTSIKTLGILIFLSLTYAFVAIGMLFKKLEV